MQYNHIISLKKIRNTPLVTTLLKLAIFLLVMGYIYYSILNKQEFDSVFSSSLVGVFYNFHYWLFLPILLVPVNWGLEAMKWKYLSRRIETITLLQSMRGIITGVTLGFATPFGLGDYIGRILQLKNPDRSKGVGAVFISRIAQFYCTLLMGGTSLILVGYKTKNQNYFDDGFDVFIGFTLLLNFIFIALFFFHWQILNMLKRLNILKNVYSYIEIIGVYSFRELAHVLTLSLVRYLVFSVQFMLLLYFFGISDDVVLLFCGVNFIFLVKSVVPTFFDLGIRESAAVYFFSNFTILTDQVIFASLSLWVLNIVLPALLGLLLIFKLKFSTQR